MKDYTSPIEMITNSIIKSNEEQLDDFLLFSVEREIGFKVDKEELVKALEYDRKQYEKGFEDGLKSAAEWIPVSERLPELVARRRYTEDVLMYDGADFRVGYFVVNDKWVTYGDDDYEPIAWMPLPEPYKASPTAAESEDKE